MKAAAACSTCTLHSLRIQPRLSDATPLSARSSSSLVICNPGFHSLLTLFIYHPLVCVCVCATVESSSSAVQASFSVFRSASCRPQPSV